MQSFSPDAHDGGRYVIHGELASGGMATVHLGQRVGPAGFSRTVAIKRLHEHLANDPEFVAMLLDEAKLVSSIHHPNVVSTLDIVCENDDLLIVMDYVEGETLAKLLREGSRSSRPTPSRSVLASIVLDVLAGLHAAHTAKTHDGHRLNIVHRDVSPQNIIVGVDGVARVLDFGVAKGERRRHSTRPGRIKGKFAYMSPEQIRGARVDARTDVFATGIVLWECLTGQRLFAHGDKERGIELVLTMPVPPPSTYDTTLSPEVDGVVLRALARDPDLRYSSAAEFAQALHAAVQPACPMEVGAWVADVAKGSIVRHARLLRELEPSTISDRASDSEWPRDAPAAGSRPPGVRAVHTDAPTVASGPPVFESGSGAVGLRSRRALWVALAAALSCIVAALGPGSSEVRAPEGLEATSAVGATSPPPRDSAPAEAHPTTVEAMTRAPTVEALPASALPLEPVASRAIPESPASRSQAPGRGGARAARRPARRTSAPALPKADASTKLASAPVLAPQLPQPSNPPPPSCDPPYRVDALGVRRVRRECL